MDAPQTADWQRLMGLLRPVHDEARLLARRVAQSNADGDDLFQEAVLRAVRKLPALREEEKFRGWFHRVLFSVHRSRTRRGFWRRLVSLDAGDSAERAPGEDGLRRADERAGADRAARALATLPAKQREAIVLFELHGCSVEEISELQAASVAAVKSRLSRGRERLRRFYRRLGVEPQKEESREYSEASV